MATILQLIHDHNLIDFNLVRTFFQSSPYNLTVRDSGSLYSLTYNQTHSHLSLPAVQEARGLFLRKHTNQIVAKGFTKFFNAHEDRGCLHLLDPNTVRYLDKIDGSLIKLYWDDDKQEFVFGTNNMFDAKEVIIGNNKSYYDLILDVRGGDIDFNRLSHQYTYLFELVHPLNRVVVDYRGDKKLVFLGAVHLPSLTDFDERTYNYLQLPSWIERPKELSFTSINDAITQIQNNTDGIEGCVAIDHNFNRIKIKSRQYIDNMHKVGFKPSKKDIIQIICRGESDEIVAYRPELKSSIDYWTPVFNQLFDHLWTQWTQFTTQINLEIREKGTGLTRKELMMIVKTLKYANFLMSFWDSLTDINSVTESQLRLHMLTRKSLVNECEKYVIQS